MATDPVCGMYVDEKSAELTLVRDNRTYYFCASACLEEFSAPQRQLARLRGRLAVGWPLSVTILLLTYVVRFPEWPWVALGLATVVQFYPGLQFYRGTIDAVRNRTWNMDVLIAVGTTVAYGYSAAATLLPGRLPPSHFFDASALIVTLILTGNYLEHLTRERARGSLRALQALLPTTAIVLREARESEVAVSEVRSGDTLRVRPGGRFPTDGTILEGRSSVSEAVLTGESLPVEKKPGDPVIAGAINGEGLLTVRATQVGEDTLLSHIGRLVTEAETARVPLQRLADRIASVFVPVVLVLAAIAAVGWLLGGAGVTIALLVFVSVAITACPCAFGIATPAAIVVGTGRAAEDGVLFKGRDSLERASLVDLVLSDKTGTLTKGEPSLSDVVPAPATSRAALLSLAAAIEYGSDHPLARAVRRRAEAEGIPRIEVTGQTAEAGRGVRGTLGGRTVAIERGSAARQRSIDLGTLASEADCIEKEGKSWSVVLDGPEPKGLLGFSDEIAPGAKEAVADLAREGIPLVMVTGDHEASARRVAEELGIRAFHSDVSPEGKLSRIRDYQRQGHRVAFVGDGINDAPALAAADLGIAIGAGTDVAKETGGVILVREDLRAVPFALRAGRRTVRKVRGNLTWAIGYNALLLPIAAGALVPAFGLGVYQILPITGALAMAISSTTVVLNSLSLRWMPFSLDRGP